VHRPRQSALRNSRGRGSREVQIQIPEGKEETYVLTYGKHIESENRFQEGTKEDAQGDGTRIYAKIMSDIDTIQRATQKSKLDPEIYVLRENQILNQNQIVDEGKITWAYGQAIDPTHGLEPNYISSQMVKFTKAIAASAHFQDPFENNDKTREEKTFSIMNPRDIERVAVLDDQYLRFYYRFFSPIFYVKTRNKETDQFISLYMKQSDSNQFRMVKFEVDRLEDTLKIKVGGPDSVSKQLEKVVLYNIAQDATDKALFLGLAQLKDKSKIEQVKILHDFFTGKNNVGVEFKNATPGLYITKQKSNTEWDLTEYYKETEGEIGAGSLVYIANGKSLMCQTKSDSIEKPLDQLVANDMQISDADHSKKTFTKLFKAIISGIKVQYGEQTVAEPKVVIDYLAEYFKGRKIFGFNTKDDKYDPVEISSSDGDTVTLELTKKVEDKDMVKYLDLDMLCVAGDNTALKNHNPNITKGRGNNPTDEEVTFEDQVKILLQFFLTEMQQRKTGLYNQRIVLHQAKLDEWKVGSTDAFLENNNNQYICLRDQDYLKTGHTKPETKDWFEDKSTIPYINTRFSDSDSSKESLNAILEAMFRKKIKCYFDREIKYFFYRCLKNPEFSRKIINAAIACVARKNEFETEYPEPPIVEITDKEYRHDKTITTHFKFEITSVNGNNVETKTILYKVDEYDLYPYEA
jgi:hypothetical protein